jgi:hypothetical protein
LIGEGVVETEMARMLDMNDLSHEEVTREWSVASRTSSTRRSPMSD